MQVVSDIYDVEGCGDIVGGTAKRSDVVIGVRLFFFKQKTAYEI